MSMAANFSTLWDILKAFPEGIFELMVRSTDTELEFTKENIQKWLNDNIDKQFDPKNFNIKEFDANEVRYLKAALGHSDICLAKCVLKSSGNMVCVWSKNQEEKMQEVINLKDKMIKGFCVDINELKHRFPNEVVMTTPVGALDDQKLMLFLPELTAAGAFYCLNDDHTISYMPSQQNNIKNAISSFSARTASNDMKYQERVITNTENIFNSIQKQIPYLKDDEAIYITSASRANSKSTAFLKITNSGYTEIIVDRRRSEKLIATVPLNFNNKEDGLKLLSAVTKYKEPVLLSQDQFSNTTYDERDSLIDHEKIMKYGKEELTANDKEIVDFLKYAHLLKINLKARNPSDVWDEIKEKMSEEIPNNKKLKTTWEKVKNKEFFEVSSQLSRYVGTRDMLTTQFIDNAVSYKEFNKDKNEI